MADETKTGNSMPAAEKKAQPLDYDSFAILNKNRSYFSTFSPYELIALAPKIHERMVSLLSRRPFEEEEMFEALAKEDERFSEAFNYILDQVQYDGENAEACKNAVQILSEGIEVRVKGESNYFGLASKLDST